MPKASQRVAGGCVSVASDTPGRLSKNTHPEVGRRLRSFQDRFQFVRVTVPGVSLAGTRSTPGYTLSSLRDKNLTVVTNPSYFFFGGTGPAYRRVSTMVLFSTVGLKSFGVSVCLFCDEQRISSLFRSS